MEDVRQPEPIKDNRLSLLESIDNLSYRTISFGFPMLTIGIIAGAVWANEAWGSYWSWDPKETWTLIMACFCFFLHVLQSLGRVRNQQLLRLLVFVVVWIYCWALIFSVKDYTYGQML